MGNIGKKIAKSEFEEFGCRVNIDQIWNKFEAIQSNAEIDDEVKGDSILGKNLELEYQKVEDWLSENNLGEYAQNFVKARVIYEDLFDLMEMLGEEGIKSELIPDPVPFYRFKIALEQLKEDRNVSVLEEKKKEKAELDVGEDREELLKKPWYLDPSFVIIGEAIAKGNFGVVRRGILRLGLLKIAIAVKESFVGEENSRKEVINEVEILTELNDMNVCKCFGCFFERNSSFIVLELCSKGDLFNFLQENPNLSFETKLDFMIQISSGMFHLHSKNFMHGDLKSKNVLLKGGIPKYRLKLCDFGTAKSTGSFENNFSGTPEYMAPEYQNLEELERKAKEKKSKKQEESTHDLLVKKLDIYAFGILIWEIFTQKSPFEEERKQSTSDFELFRRIHANHLKPNIEEMVGAPQDLKDLVDACIDDKPEQRPDSFELITYEIGEILESYKAEKEEEEEEEYN